MAPTSPRSPTSAAAGTPSKARNPILAFQDEIDAMSKTRRHSAHAKDLGTEKVVDQVENLQLGDDGEADGGEEDQVKAPTIKDRLLGTAALLSWTSAPPTAQGKAISTVVATEQPALVTSLAALFSSQMDVGHGETMVYLGAHNLSDRTLSSLFESEEGAPLPSSSGAAPAPVQERGLNKAEHAQAVKVISQAATEAGAEASVIWMGFDEEGRSRALPVEKEGTPGTAAINDEDVIRRWVAHSTRMSVVPCLYLAFIAILTKEIGLQNDKKSALHRPRLDRAASCLRRQCRRGQVDHPGCVDQG